MNASVSRRVRTRAVPTLLLAAMSAGVLAADGTIHFVGAIVASPYEITGAAAPAALPGKVGTGTRGEVVFERQWIDRPSASMEIHALDAQPLRIVFIDSAGHRREFDGDRAFGVGRDGGRLSVMPQLTGRGGTTALMTVSYD